MLRGYNMIVFVLVVLLGVYLRLDQLLIQTLLDDEWHAVYQLQHNSPQKIFLSFGFLDHSIPLTLFYWFEARFFGLSEIMMRWPMILFGLATLVFFPRYIYKKFSYQEFILFSFLIATSPLLVMYSRTARPYAITLFLVYFSIWLFYKYYNSEKRKFFYGVFYSFSAALAVWLHLAVVFFVLSPFFLEIVKVFWDPKEKQPGRFISLLYLGALTIVLMCAVILPPLWNDFGVLTTKQGAIEPLMDPLIGAVYLWNGSQSGLVVLIFSILALIGFPRIFKKSIFTQVILVGFSLTFGLILILKVAFMQHALILARYLLPVLPLLLLSVVSGIYVLYLRGAKSKIIKFSLHILLIGLLIGMVRHSPTFKSIYDPQTMTRHSKIYFDFRKDKNKIKQKLEKGVVSKFWQTLSEAPYQKNIALAPWDYLSFRTSTDIPKLEKISHQYILPGLREGFCEDGLEGEAPKNERFQFRNVAYIGDIYDLQEKGIKFIVYQKEGGEGRHSTERCLFALKYLFGRPYYEDELIVVHKPLFYKADR